MQGDFNGDGYDDMAIGVPYEDYANIQDSGAVNVVYGSSTGLNYALNKIWDQQPLKGGPEAGDRFGEVLAVGDFDGDGFDDLAIGVPFEDLGGFADAGAVNVMYGSAAGLTTARNQMLYQGRYNISGILETGDRFGSSLAAADFNGDGYDDLFVGVPYEDIDGFQDAGAINLIYGSAVGLAPQFSFFASQLFHQNSAGIPGACEADDRFGWALAAGDFNNDGCSDIAVGVPHEDIGNIKDAGAVNIIYGEKLFYGWLPVANHRPASQILHQNTDRVPGACEAGDCFGFSLATGDFNGDGRDDLAVGVPFEDIGLICDSGAVNVIYGSSNGLMPANSDIWQQNSSGVMDSVGHRDNFGFSLAAADFNNDGLDDLAIGVPNEDIGTVADAGAVNVLLGSYVGLTPTGNQIWYESQTGVGGRTFRGDRFGYCISSGDFNGDGAFDLLVGIPFKPVGNAKDAGAVRVLYGDRRDGANSGGLAGNGSRLWTQYTAQQGGLAGTAEANDRLGFFHGNTEHPTNYAVLFSGGVNPSGNFKRYYNNIKKFYEKIIANNWVSPENIFVIYADGDNNAVDRPDGLNSNMTFAADSTVLEATPDNLRAVLARIADLVDGDDHFLFYSFDHGSGALAQPNVTREEVLNGWGANIRDDQLAPWLDQIDAGYSTYVLAECFAGGMLDDLRIGTNEFGCAATNHYELSFGVGFANAFVDALQPTRMNTHAVYRNARDDDPYSAWNSANALSWSNGIPTLEQYARNRGQIRPGVEHPWCVGDNFAIFAAPEVQPSYIHPSATSSNPSGGNSLNGAVVQASPIATLSQPRVVRAANAALPGSTDSYALHDQVRDNVASNRSMLQPISVAAKEQALSLEQTGDVPLDRDKLGSVDEYQRAVDHVFEQIGTRPTAIHLLKWRIC